MNLGNNTSQELETKPNVKQDRNKGNQAQEGLPFELWPLVNAVAPYAVYPQGLVVSHHGKHHLDLVLDALSGAQKKLGQIFFYNSQRWEKTFNLPAGGI